MAPVLAHFLFDFWIKLPSIEFSCLKLWLRENYRSRETQKVKGVKVNWKKKSVMQKFCIKKTHTFTVTAMNFVQEQLKTNWSILLSYFTLIHYAFNCLNNNRCLSFLHLKNDLCFLSSCSELLAGDNMGTGSHNFEKRTGIMGLEGDADLRDSQNGENYPCQISVRKILKQRVSLCFNQLSQLSLR